jgi:nitronate monooxygenase
MRMFDGLSLPVIAAPMFLVSGPELVIAACKAGIVGAFPTPNARSVADLDVWMTRIRAEVGDRPWCANLVTHSTNARLAEDLALVARHKPPLVVTALGSPRPAVEVVRAYGGRVLADVTTIRLAHKALQAGADGLACICAGAGGHTGTLNPFAFVRAVREFHAGPLVVGGGISDGWGVAGAIAAGADAVYMGTAFLAAEESLAPAAYKDMVAAATVEDLIVSPAITGTPASWLIPSLVQNGLDPANLPAVPERAYDTGASFKGKRWAQVWSAGQGVGAVRGTEPAAAIVARLSDQFARATARLAGPAHA